MMELKVAIDHRVVTDEIDIYVLRRGRESPRMVEVARMDDEGHLVYEEHEEGVVVEEPTLRLPRTLAIELSRELSELGYPTEQESTVRGKLEAQSEHLSDLQHLLGLRSDE